MQSLAPPPFDRLRPNSRREMAANGEAADATVAAATDDAATDTAVATAEPAATGAATATATTGTTATATSPTDKRKTSISAAYKGAVAPSRPLPEGWVAFKDATTKKE